MVCAGRAYWAGMAGLETFGLSGILVTTGVFFRLHGGRARSRAALWGGAPLRTVGELPQGERTAVCGAATSPWTGNGPVSGRPCLFYHHVLERLDVRGSGSSRRREWRLVVDSLWGGFFVADGPGRVLVLPRGATMASYPHEKRSSKGLGLVEGDERSVERRFEEGDRVFAVGTPRSLTEAVERLRARPEEAALPPELVKAMVKAAEDGDPTLCLFADGGPFVVGAGEHGAWLAGVRSSGDSGVVGGYVLVGTGLLLFVAALFGLL